MKCPMLTMGWVSANPELRPQDVDCLKEECAWWSLDDGGCILQAFNNNLIDLISALKDIRDKIPHEE